MSGTKRMSQTYEIPPIGKELAEVFAPIVFGLSDHEPVTNNILCVKLLSSTTSLAELVGSGWWST
jgi:hypothetical protein